MITEFIKLVPTLDRSALNSMFANLNSRFTSVARKFGDGMKNALKFGGIVGIASALISKLVNPLQKAEEIIDRILNKGDDAVTNAEEFNSDPGKILRLQAVGRAKGLDPETLFNLVRKFQGSLAKEQEAAQAPERIQKKLTEEKDPLKRRELEVQLKDARETAKQGGTLHEFIDEKDTVEAFFKFVQSLQKVDKAQQTVVQSEVFGERERVPGKAAEFLNATDFAEILAKLPTAGRLKVAAEKTGKLSDQRDLLTAIRETEDLVTKSDLVKESHIKGLDTSARLDLKDENKTLERFDATLSSSIAIQQLTQKFDQFTTDFINTIAPEMVKGINVLSKAATDFLPSFQETKKKVTEGLDKGVETLADIYGWATNLFGGGENETATPTPADPNALSPFMQKSFERSEQLNQDLRDMKDSIDRFNKGAYAIWDEFKASRLYRTFGGGN